jgi:hypothetical protein
MFCGRLRRDRQNRTFSAGPNPELTYSPYDLTDETTGAAAAIVIPKRYMMIVRLKHLASTNGEVIRAYLSMIGGSAGRLVISLVYFIAIANTLSISEFGLFATASACGIMLSRLMAFGFVSPLYRIATVKTTVARGLHGRISGRPGAVIARSSPLRPGHPLADLHRPDGACDLRKDHRGRSAVLADHGDRRHRQLRVPTGLAPVPRWWWRQPRSRPSRPFSSPGWPMARLPPGAGTTSAPMAWQRCWRWCSSIPCAAALETGALHPALGRCGIGGRCGNAVLHPVGARQGAGALAWRTLKPPASTP